MKPWKDGSAKPAGSTKKEEKELASMKSGINRFGIELVERSKTDESDDSIIIPEPIQSILDDLKESKGLVSKKNNTQQISLIESLSLSKRKQTDEIVYYPWIEDLLRQDEKSGTKSPKSISSISCSNGPLLLSESDIIRVSTPQREQFYKVTISIQFVVCQQFP